MIANRVGSQKLICKPKVQRWRKPAHCGARKKGISSESDEGKKKRRRRERRPAAPRL